MGQESKSLRDAARTGATYGLKAWVIYGVVELWCVWALAWVASPHVSRTVWDWGYEVALLIFYGVVGVVVGGSLGIILRLVPSFGSMDRRSSAATRTVVGLTIVAAVLVNLLVFRYAAYFPGLLVVLVFLAAVLSSSYWSGPWLRRLSFVGNPWIASLMLLGVFAIVFGPLRTHRLLVRGTATLSWVALIACLAYLTVRARERISSRGLPTGGVLREHVIISGALLLSLTVGFLQVDFLRGSGETGGPSPSPSVAAPNIIIIVMDTVRADHLSLYGYERDTTPSLEEISNDSVVYTRAIASGDMTLTSHASMFTGLYGLHHGAHFNAEGYPQPLDEEFDTLAEILSTNGYQTSAVISNHVFFGNGFGLEQGFAYSDSRDTPQHRLLHRAGNLPGFFLRRRIHGLLRRVAPEAALDAHYRSAEDINEEAFYLLDRVKRADRPAFLFLNYMDAHRPYRPPVPYDTLYPGKDASFTQLRFYDLLHDVVSQRARGISAQERDHLLSQYDGAIAYLDFHIGRLFAELKRVGLYESSLIIITSDHGEAFGEKDLVEHGVSVYQDQLHVPLLIKYPNRSGRTFVDRSVSIVDILPTVLGVAGLDVPDAVVGRSLVTPALHPSLEVYGESYPNPTFLGARFDRVERAIFSGSLKLINSTEGRMELFDLAADPNETENLYGQLDAGVVMAAQLNEWLAEHRWQDDERRELDEATLRHLRTLGYIK